VVEFVARGLSLRFAARGRVCGAWSGLWPVADFMADGRMARGPSSSPASWLRDIMEDKVFRFIRTPIPQLSRNPQLLTPANVCNWSSFLTRLRRANVLSTRGWTRCWTRCWGRCWNELGDRGGSGVDRVCEGAKHGYRILGSECLSLEPNSLNRAQG
jgi:hypothetical protein